MTPRLPASGRAISSRDVYLGWTVMYYGPSFGSALKRRLSDSFLTGMVSKRLQRKSSRNGTR